MFVMNHQIAKAEEFDGGNAFVSAIIEMLDSCRDLFRKRLLDPFTLDRGGEAKQCHVFRAAARDLPDARIVAISHPLGGIDEDTVRARAASAVDAVHDLVMRPSEG